MIPPEGRAFELLRRPMWDYEPCAAWQRRRAAAIAAGGAGQALLLTEHPPVYTVGRRATPEEIVGVRFGEMTLPVVPTDRGGRTTYHGPGQSMVYVLRDLRPHPMAVREHVHRLEGLAIAVLAGLGLRGERLPGLPGVWVEGEKIAALGVRVSRGVAYHGLSLNRDPELAHYAGILPCGLTGRRVTSLAALGVSLSRAELEARLAAAFVPLFGATVEGEESSWDEEG
ncbi:MAG: lipoyl(octanoyl) transferase LipB [Magnetococcales bacterium]|nr:lipoyl(octanoyl) transferase LipB [Magnetococcales bacterium]